MRHDLGEAALFGWKHFPEKDSILSHWENKCLSPEGESGTESHIHYICTYESFQDLKKQIWIQQVWAGAERLHF